jgi:predicted nucleic acid-binding protein
MPTASGIRNKSIYRQNRHLLDKYHRRIKIKGSLLMVIVDSCGWLEWFTDGKLADAYQKYLADQDNLLVPAIIVYEVYKVLKREVGEEKALLAAGYMKNSTVIPLDETLALAAADIALQESLAMADAIIVAAARAHKCTIISSDSDLKDQPNVDYIPKD